MEIEKEIVREDARVLKIEEKLIVEHKSSPGEADVGFDNWIVLNNWFFFNFLTPAHPRAQSLFLFPIVFGINNKITE